MSVGSVGFLIFVAMVAIALSLCRGQALRQALLAR